MQTTENRSGWAFIGLILLVLAMFACGLAWFAFAAGGVAW